MGLTKHKTPEAAPAAVETTKKATAAAVAAEATPVDVSEIGKKSGTIAFVAPLGDPSHADNTYTKGANGENIKATTAYIVGYRFKALEDMTVPECGLDKDATKNLRTPLRTLCPTLTRMAPVRLRLARSSTSPDLR